MVTSDITYVIVVIGVISVIDVLDMIIFCKGPLFFFLFFFEGKKYHTLFCD